METITTIVCGTPRSGCGLLMQLLEAAGIPTVGEFPTYEVQEYPPSLEGMAVKIIDPHDRVFPIGQYRFIHVKRSRKQNALSVLKMTKLRDGIDPNLVPSDESIQRVEDTLAEVERLNTEAIKCHGMPILSITFEDIICRTDSALWMIMDFMGIDNPTGGKLGPMANVVIPRSSACFDGLLESILLEARKGESDD